MKKGKVTSLNAAFHTSCIPTTQRFNLIRVNSYPLSSSSNPISQTQPRPRSPTSLTTVLVENKMVSPSSASPADSSNISPKKQSLPTGSAGAGFVTPPFIQTPLFIHQFLKPHKIADAASTLVRKIDTSISVNLEKCLRLAQLLASQNPLLEKFSSITSDFNAFCQMQRRKSKNLNPLSTHNFAAVLPGDSVAGIVVTNGILNFLNIYNTLLVVRLVLTWFPNAPPAIVSPLSTLCDPYLNIFRGIIPPLGGTLDLSPILAFVILNAFTSAAAALPAELPPAGASRQASSNARIFDLTSSQKKWMTRLHNSIKSKDSSDPK